MFVSKSFSIVGRATLIAEKSLAITTTASPMATRASQFVRCDSAMRVRVWDPSAEKKRAGVRYPWLELMARRIDSLALLLLLPPRGE
jgi:hypothetical protein